MCIGLSWRLKLKKIAKPWLIIARYISHHCYILSFFSFYLLSSRKGNETHRKLFIYSLFFFSFLFSNWNRSSGYEIWSAWIMKGLLRTYRTFDCHFRHPMKCLIAAIIVCKNVSIHILSRKQEVKTTVEISSTQ